MRKPTAGARSRRAIADPGPRAALLLVLALVAGACTHKVDITAPSGGGGGGGPVVTGVVTPPAVQAVFDAHCVFCHSGGSPSGGQNLGSALYSYRNLVRVPANEDSNYVRVLPGDAANSYLWMNLTADPRIHGAAMPLGAPALDATTLAVVSSWIAGGALPETLYAPSALALPVADRLR